MDVNSVELGLVGRCDVVVHGDEGVQVIEYKATPVRRVAEVTEANRVQLACQALGLTEMGEPVIAAGVHFTQHDTFVRVTLDSEAYSRRVTLLN